ncbi:Protoporphyrinogen oxidase [Penicillium alfredii]|uniref:Protoporphyrinogen oxidase n=1 Tax=Penicillium alfredii TaxID=1506179 RepID=A0A9W9FSQ4_9EURO|nr:Protoporphyrinogen oxidase [Penicillium alfredii]KAJ5105335.1 Protoporphyrinogen oxidase [Penicillium alfredii]
MRLPCVASGLRAGRRPLVSVLHGQHRTYNTAVIGAGITGLTAAWQLAQDPQCSQVTLYEKSSRLGGWLDSEVIPVDGGEVVFEYGPRTLRSASPASIPFLSLIVNLGIFDDLIATSKLSPAARNRFIYYPDRLVRLPSLDREGLRNLRSTLKEPVFEGFLQGLLWEHAQPARDPSEWAQDESVASFISRRFNSHVADNLVSSVYHGIYAGDIDQLSAQTLMGGIRNLEGTGILAGLGLKAFTGSSTRLMDDFMALDAAPRSRDVLDHEDAIHRVAKESSTFTFKRGVRQLIEALVAGLKHDANLGQIITEDKRRATYDRVISAIPAPALAKLIAPTNHPTNVNPQKSMALLQQHNYATTVMVVNLYYSDPNILPAEGFGYLIPRSIPFEQNPECGLGVIFASSSSTGQHPSMPSLSVSQDSAPGTKLTVMLGGHYWDGFKENDYPDHDTAVDMARAMLRRHIGITQAPKVVRTRLQHNAIPQYTVGHLDRMYELSDAVRSEFDHRLVLGGNWYNGVGVGECVRQGILAATYGVGQRQLRTNIGDGNSPWKEYDYHNWELEGGITMPPVRLFESTKKDFA